MSHLPSRFERRKPEDPLTRRDEALAFEASDETWRPPDWFARIVVVLVETNDVVNIGGVIRAMHNTGFVRLRLVSPPAYDAWQLIGIAHYAQHIVDGIETFDSLRAAVADVEYVIGLTGRHHRIGRNQQFLSDAVGDVVDTAHSGATVAIVLGREDWGLSNEMLDACHAVTTIPTNPAYPSLNLAQAALLMLFQLFQRAGGEQQAFKPSRRAAPPAPSGLLEDLFADLERALDAVEFLHSRSRLSALRSFRVLLYRARLDVREASLVRAAVIEVRRFLLRKGLLREIGDMGAHRPAKLTPQEGAGILTPSPPLAESDSSTPTA